MSLENYKAAAISLVFIAIIIAGGALALDAFNEDRVTAQTVQTTSNESVTLTNGTAVALANNWVISVSAVYIEIFGNATDNTTAVGSGNYTITNAGTANIATITLTNGSYDGNQSWVTYTYYDEEAQVETNATNEGLIGLANSTSYLSTIGTLIGVAALIAVVLGAVYFFKR